MKIRKKEILIACISFMVGFVAHFFIIANPLFNADGIFYNRSIGAGSILGRWFIEILNNISQRIGYVAVVPMLNVVLSLAIIAFSSIYFVRILKIEKDIYRLLISCALILSPSLVQTFFYGFTSHVYALAIALTIMSVYELIEKNRILTSIILLCLGMALYQAYIPFMFTFYLVVFIRSFVYDDIKSTFIKMLKAFISAVISFILYFMLNKIINARYDGYIFHIHGMSDNIVPEFNIGDILNATKKTYIATYDLMMHHNVFAHNTTVLARYIYIIILCMTAILFIYFLYHYIFKQALYKKEKNIIILKSIFIILLFCLLPFAINFMFVMTNDGINYHDDRLSLSYVFYLILPIVFINIISNIRISKISMAIFKVFEKIVIVSISIILIHNIWLSYGSYYNQYKVINASKAFALELATNIKMLDGYHSDIEVLFIDIPYEKNSYSNYAYYADVEYDLYSNFDMEYENILSEYPMKQVFKEFAAFDFKEATDDFAENLKYSSEVREMPLYPEDGSVKIIEGIVVVKFREII